jgi:transcriptional regulator with XRE-family HTH domain
MRRTVTSPRHKALVTLIRTEREAAGMRQEDVAAKLGQNYMWMQRVESGERRIDVVEFCALASVIGFDARKAITRLFELRA